MYVLTMASHNEGSGVTGGGVRCRKRWLFCVLHKIRMVAADGLDAQSLGTDVYCVIVCH